MSARLCAGLLALLMLAGPGSAAAERLDWDPDEEEAAGFVEILRHKRDGPLGILDDFLDLQLAVFAELALLTGSALMLTSDVVGLVDDNPITQHVTKSAVSKSLAKTAYLFHVAGAESILGSHGLELEWYLEDSMSQVNPLLDSEDSGPELPLHPLDFFEEGTFHTKPLTARVPLGIAVTAIVADGVIRPVGNVLLFFDLAGPADATEDFGTGLVRSAVP